MKRILISWVAVRHDFDAATGGVLKTGPNFMFHQHFYKGRNYDKHILLSSFKSGKEDPGALRLAGAIENTWPQDHTVEVRFLDLPPGGVIDFNQIHSKVSGVLSEFAGVDIDIFVSPGTPAMQVVWHIAKMEWPENIRLFQTVAPRDSPDNKTHIIEIDLRNAPIAAYILRKEITDKRIIPESNDESELYRPEILRELESKVDIIAMMERTPVLIQGGSGTGKEHVAHRIHRKSPRHNKRYTAINCAAVGNDLLESRLFGYRAGAFTHAVKDTKGIIESVDGGTLFLDEIGDISPNMQVTLLRVLESGKILPVGATEPVDVNVRIVAATHRDLYRECEAGRFRWDLYYRLAVAEVSIPPLVSWSTADIRNLIDFFNRRAFTNLKVSEKPLNFSDKAMNRLLQHHWPGNIRELKNLIEGLYALGVPNISEEMLPQRILNSTSGNNLLLENVIRNHVRQVVAQCNGNKERARRLLGLGSVNTVNKYLNTDDSENN